MPLLDFEALNTTAMDVVIVVLEDGGMRGHDGEGYIYIQMGASMISR